MKNTVEHTIKNFLFQKQNLSVTMNKYLFQTFILKTKLFYTIKNAFSSIFLQNFYFLKNL